MVGRHAPARTPLVRPGREAAGLALRAPPSPPAHGGLAPLAPLSARLAPHGGHGRRRGWRRLPTPPAAPLRYERHAGGAAAAPGHAGDAPASGAPPSPPPPRRAPPHGPSPPPPPGRLRAAGRRPPRWRHSGRGGPQLGRPGTVREAVQAAAYQAGLYAGRRGARPGHAVRQRVQPDDHLPVRGPAAELQEHVQVEAAAGQVAGGGRQHDGIAHVHRQDRGAGAQAEKAHQHRGVREGRPREPLPQAAEARGAGDREPRRQPAAREGGGASVVLQPEAKREAHDAPHEQYGQPDDAGRRRRTHDGREPPARAQPQQPHAIAPSAPALDGRGPLTRGRGRGLRPSLRRRNPARPRAPAAYTVLLLAAGALPRTAGLQVNELLFYHTRTAPSPASLAEEGDRNGKVATNKTQELFLLLCANLRSSSNNELKGERGGPVLGRQTPSPLLSVCGVRSSNPVFKCKEQKNKVPFSTGQEHCQSVYETKYRTCQSVNDMCYFFLIIII